MHDYSDVSAIEFSEIYSQVPLYKIAASDSSKTFLPKTDLTCQPNTILSSTWACSIIKISCIAYFRWVDLGGFGEMREKFPLLHYMLPTHQWVSLHLHRVQEEKGSPVQCVIPFHFLSHLSFGLLFRPFPPSPAPPWIGTLLSTITHWDSVASSTAVWNHEVHLGARL